MVESGPLQLQCVNQVMSVNVKDSTSEVLNIKLQSDSPKELVAVGQIKLASLQFVANRVENVPLVNKTGQ
jgi:hypothetical protein